MQTIMSLRSTLLLFPLAFLAISASASPDSHSEAFEQILNDHWQHENQEKIFFRNDPDAFRMNGTLPDMSQQGRSRRQKVNQELIQRLADIDLSQLSSDDQVTYKLFAYERQAEAKTYQQLDRYFPLNYYSGYHSYFAGAPANMSFLTRDDYENYLVSLADFPRYNQEFIEDLSAAVNKGYVHYCETFRNYDKSISKHIVSDIEESVFWAPLANIPTSISDQHKGHYQQQAKRLIAEKVIPEYQKFYDFFTQQYMPNCRKVAGISSVDSGPEYYKYLIEYYTTTELDAEQIHQIGLNEVARIKKDMLSIINDVGFEGSFSEFIAFLRNDEQFYTDTALDLVEKASYITRKMAGQLPKWFSVLPRTTFDIKSSPNGGAYYVASDGSGTIPGTYFLDTQDLRSQPLYTLEALTFHEAEPGHHFQSSIAQEIDMANFRKKLYHSAYGEGWGLYSERLGKEMGFYQDPYSDFGRLTYEAWRACRLVVDTGIHAKGWTRQQAIDYLAENTALSMNDVIGQIDRYISWPAQALSYKIGELKIVELREFAQSQLGEQFDVRKFHDQILKNGSLPLDLLEELTKDWVAEQQKITQ